MKKIIILSLFIALSGSQIFAETSGFKTFTPNYNNYNYWKNYDKYNYPKQPVYLSPAEMKLLENQKYYYYSNPYNQFYNQQKSSKNILSNIFNRGQITGLSPNCSNWSNFWNNSSLDDFDTQYQYHNYNNNSNGGYYYNNYGTKNRSTVHILN